MAEANTQAILKIRQLMDQGRMGEALSELKVLLSAQPDSGMGQALMGRILFREVRDFTPAEEYFRSAMRLSPQYPPLYEDYGELLIHTGRNTEAIAVLNRSLEVPGVEKDRIYRLFGQLYERESKWDDAIEHYNKAFFYTLDNTRAELYKADLQRVKDKMSYL